MDYLTKQTSIIFYRYFKEQGIFDIDKMAFELGVERQMAFNWINGYTAPGIRELTRIKSQYHDWRYKMAGELGEVILKHKQESKFNANIKP